ncbi:MAG: hypothetical protein WC304_00210 [Candidatus Gracilibacteria bacterium]|jgi:hypothetical protein
MNRFAKFPGAIGASALMGCTYAMGETGTTASTTTARTKLCSKFLGAFHGAAKTMAPDSTEV